MDKKYSSLLAVLFYTLILVHRGAGDLSTLFGTTAEDDDIVLYSTIGFIVLSVILIIIMIICLYWLHKWIKRRNKRRQEQIALEDKSRWRGGVDDIIDDAHRMVPLPRATNTLEKGYENNGINFVNSRI